MERYSCMLPNTEKDSGYQDSQSLEESLAKRSLQGSPRGNEGRIFQSRDSVKELAVLYVGSHLPVGPT